MQTKTRIDVGDHVLVRTYSAGVVAGTLTHREGREATLVDARRLWHWDGAATLHELADRGLSRPQGCKFPAMITGPVILTEVIEIIATTPAARASIAAIPAWREH